MISNMIEAVRLKNFKLKTKLIITYILLTVIPMAVLGYIIYYQNTKAIEEEVGEYVPRLLNQANRNIENEINELGNLPNLIYNSSDVMAVLRASPYEDRSSLLQDQFTVESFLSRAYLGSNNANILGAYLLSNNGSFISTRVAYEGFDFTKNPLPYGEAHDLGGDTKVLLPNQVNLTFEGNPPYMLLVKEIIDLDNRETLGTMFLAVKLTFIEEILQDLDEEDKALMWVMDDQGQIIYHPDQTKIGTYFEELNQYPLLNGSFRTNTANERTLISINQSSKQQWILVHRIPINYLTERTDVVRNAAIIIFLILVVITTLISIIVAWSVTKPINVLGKKMKDVEKGNLHIKIPIHSRDEVGVLASSFQSMITKLRDQIKKNDNIEIRQKEAELYALQSQINPHFMYNTLETIGASIEDGESDLVVDMVAILGRMLRFSLSNKDKIVPISQEVLHIEDYLTLQKFRFEERISFSIHKDQEQDLYLTPKFILQPIVENSIKYGMQKRKALNLEIEVNKDETDHAMVFVIRDNGPGIKEEDLSKLKDLLNKDPMINRDSGFGLTNVHARIVMMYGSNYGLTITSKEEQGTEVIIKIPLLVKKENGDG
ncbi:sensor histidine kinase [uncultured Metabacillus sp.]|uniref:cache domain-containing sensor histidine kinase n=1 Tax=uncultured Metabacillus sp. TaxID=2860135 RepID=UPI002623CFBA|nr:sensor histidine kinase [uncultured Metabacillus sp.]